MVIQLTGVLEDGSTPAAWVPFDVRAGIEIPAGISTTIRLRLVTRSGMPVRLGGGEQLVMTARESTIRPSRGYFTLAAVAAPLVGPGIYDFTATHTLTQYLGGLHGVYDVRLVRSTSTDAVIPVSAIRFPGVAAAASGAVVTPTVPPAAAQDTTERSFTWTAVTTATTQTVTIPGGGMVDASYAVVAFVLRDPAPGDGAHPDALFPTAGRLAGSFTVVTDSPIRAGSVYDVVLRDRGA